WLRSGVIEKNHKDTYKSTLDALYDACPLNVTRKSLGDSLRDILQNDPAFRLTSQIHITVFEWLKKGASSRSSAKKKPLAIFKKAHLRGSAFGPGAVVNNYTNGRVSSSPPSEQAFSLSGEEQRAIVEPFLILVEKALHQFLVDNESCIPANIVKAFVTKQHPPTSPDFRAADVLCLLNFIIENIDTYFKSSAFYGQHKAILVELLSDFKMNVRDQMSHGMILDQMGRWNDRALLNFAHMACKVVILLGVNHEDPHTTKKNTISTTTMQWISTAATEVSAGSVGFIRDIPRPPKRKLDDVNFDKMTDFIMNVLEEMEEAESGQKKKVARLTLEEDCCLVEIWRTIDMMESKKEQICKFLWYVNSVFDV
ncbi:hypothetical protein BC936DRAFT_138472, partial [Jimgerdemannia flammicorona]